MALHLGARAHAFVHGLFRPSEAAQTAELYAEVSQLHASLGLDAACALDRLAAVGGRNIATHFAVPPPPPATPTRPPVAHLPLR